VAIIDEFRLKNRIWRSQNEIKALKKELSTLRNIPLQDTMIEKNEEKEKPQEEKTVKQKESK
jgi:hypothetical protein